MVIKLVTDTTRKDLEQHITNIAPHKKTSLLPEIFNTTMFCCEKHKMLGQTKCLTCTDITSTLKTTFEKNGKWVFTIKSCILS